VETGSPAALLRALDLIRGRELGTSEFGRVMNAVIVTLLQKLYPDTYAAFPSIDPPQSHSYTRILREAEKGNYSPAPANSQDYLEQVLPFLSFLWAGGGKSFSAEQLQRALPDLLRAQTLKENSVLAPLFLGILYEGSGLMEEAAAEYTRAYDLSPDCYPAALGLVRVMEKGDQKQEAIRLLSDLVIRYPDNTAIKRQLAIAYYNNRDWSRAEPAIAEILQRDSRDKEFILMRAHVLVEEGQYLQAQAPLDLYGTMDANNRLYLFLRARVQAEGYRNRDAALNYLRSIIRSSAGDDEAVVYAARLLLESNRREDQTEGRDLLNRLLAVENPALPVITLALQDAIRREAWREARPYLDRLLRERRSAQDLMNAYTVERGLGNNAAALQAARMIESRLSTLPGGALKSRYYYLRSRLRANDDAAMNDLRSSLFEDPRNLSALIAMFEIYQRRKDERRAVYYLKQALALAPDNPLLKRYEAEYAALLGTGY
jgi:predicted Zn-dependent protease